MSTETPTQTPEATAPATKSGPESVPYDRFRAILKERDELRSTLDAQVNETNTWRERAATADTLAEQLRAAQTQHEAERAAWGTKAAAYQHGVTDSDLVDLALWQYDRLQVEAGAEKPAFGDWLAGLKEQPDAIPTTLAGLKQVWAPPAPAAAPAADPAPQQATPAPQAASPTTGAPVTTARPQPPANAGVVGSTAPPPGSHAPGSISSMSPAQFRAWYKEQTGIE